MRRRRPIVHRWSWWDEVDGELYGVGGGARSWVCKLCGYERSGGSHKVRAHLLHEPGKEVRFCTKITPEKRQELLDKLMVSDAAAVESARRNVRVAVDPNTMAPAPSRRHATPTARGFSPQQHTQTPLPSRPSGVGASIRARQSTLQENWNPRLKEETDMAVARFYFHDHIPFHVAR